jgi:hypothetical protein
MLLCAGIASFLFFAGLAFIVPATVLLLFCLILFLLINSQEYYSLGQHSYAENLFKKPAKGSVTGIILNIMISIFFPALFGYIFFKYTRDFYKNITLVENFNTSQMTAIIDDISSDYVPLMLVIICGLTVSIFWFIAILNFRRRKN